jgi:hypothetical protein
MDKKNCWGKIYMVCIGLIVLSMQVTGQIMPDSTAASTEVIFAAQNDEADTRKPSRQVVISPAFTMNFGKILTYGGTLAEGVRSGKLYWGVTQTFAFGRRSEEENLYRISSNGAALEGMSYTADTYRVFTGAGFEIGYSLLNRKRIVLEPGFTLGFWVLYDRIKVSDKEVGQWFSNNKLNSHIQYHFFSPKLKMIVHGAKADFKTEVAAMGNLSRFTIQFCIGWESTISKRVQS